MTMNSLLILRWCVSLVSINVCCTHFIKYFITPFTSIWNERMKTPKNRLSKWFPCGIPKIGRLSSTDINRNWERKLWKHLNKMMLLGLAVQMTTVKASDNITTPMIPAVNTDFELDTSVLLNYTTGNGVGKIINHTDNTAPEPYHPMYAVQNFTEEITTGREISANDSESNGYDLQAALGGELLQELLNQFDMIYADLNELAEKLSAHRNSTRNKSSQRTGRAVRALPLDESPTCEIEQAVLSNFKTELQVTLTGTSQANAANCPLNFNADSCEEFVKLVLCGYSHLKTGFLLAIANSASLEEVTMWKNKLDEYKENSARVLDNKISSLSQKYNQEIVNLKTDMQNVQKTLNTAIENLKAQYIKKCISEISSGKIESAITEYKELNDSSKLLQIIQSVYRDYGQLDQIDNIVSFMRKLPSCTDDKIAFPVLYDEMRDKNHLTSPKILIVQNAAETCMSETPSGEKLQESTNSIIDTWASLIRADKHEDIKEHLKEGCGEFANPHWSRIIENAYANNINFFEIILKFIRSLPCINQTARCLTALFDQMKKNGHLYTYEVLLMADKIKQEYDFIENNPDFQYGEDDHDYYEKVFTDLKNNLPGSVSGLIWNGTRCTIKNKAHGYLYAAHDKFRYDSERGKVFTYGLTITQGYYWPIGFWTFEIEDNAKTFAIKNTHYDKYLFASTLSKNDQKCWVFYWKPGGKVIQGSWKLKPVDKTNYFTIINTSHNEYLYADGNIKEGNNADRRGVFTWRVGTPQGVMKEESHWEIACQHNNTFT